MNTCSRFSAKASLLSAVTGLVMAPAGIALAQEGADLYGRQPAAQAGSAVQTSAWWTESNPGFGSRKQRVVQTSGTIPSAAAKVNGTTTANRSKSGLRITRPAPVAAQVQSEIPAATPSAGTSEIQRQLEALYRRDGRQMPSMDLNSAAAAATSNAAAQQAAAAQAPPYQPKPSLLDRILGRKPAPLRTPQKIAVPGKHAVPSAVASKPNPRSVITPPVEPQPFQAPVESVAPNTAPSTETQLARQATEANVPKLAPSEDSAEFFPEVAESKSKAAETPFSGLKLDHESEMPITGTSAGVAAQTGSGDDSREAPYKLLASRTGKPGFRGFCPVTLKLQRKLVDSKPDFASDFQSVTYTFASAEAKAEFDADPASFVPAASGIDVVKYDDDGDKIPGSLEHAVWYQGKLFLFASQESLDKFVEDPADYADLD